MPYVDLSFPKTTPYLQKDGDPNNIYRKRLQQKIDKEWHMRGNLVTIEEEINRQGVYTQEYPTYTPIEIVPGSVKTDTGTAMGYDWCRARFRDCQYPVQIGKRYRFNWDWKSNSKLTEEEKRIQSSIWLTVNFTPPSPTASAILRRCNSNIAFGGSTDFSDKNITEIHYEPCILDTQFKYINLYYNHTLNVPQAQIYVIMQYNYFTQWLRINDRFLIGDTFDDKSRNTNSAFLIKAIDKFSTSSTFSINTSEILADVPLILMALDRDVEYSEKDNVNTRLASDCAKYLVPSEIPVEPGVSVLKIEGTPFIAMGETETFSANVILDGVIQSTPITFSLELENSANPSLYFKSVVIGNSISIENLRIYTKGRLKLTASSDGLSNTIYIELGGY